MYAYILHTYLYIVTTGGDKTFPSEANIRKKNTFRFNRCTSRHVSYNKMRESSQSHLDVSTTRI